MIERPDQRLEYSSHGSEGPAAIFQGIQQLLVIVIAVNLCFWVLPIATALARQAFPTSWQRQPYVLFLRRFSGTSDTAALGPLIAGAGSGAHVVLLSSPSDRAKSWDPFVLFLVGLRFRDVFKPPIVFLVSDGDRWNDDVSSLAADALGVVIDVSDMSPSIEAEVSIVRTQAHGGRTLWLLNAEAKQETIQGGGNAILFHEKRSGASASRLMAFALIAASSYSSLWFLVNIVFEASGPSGPVSVLLVLASGGVAAEGTRRLSPRTTFDSDSRRALSQAVSSWFERPRGASGSGRAG
jgi:hypothetical protein